MAKEEEESTEKFFRAFDELAEKDSDPREVVEFYARQADNVSSYDAIKTEMQLLLGFYSPLRSKSASL